MQDFYRTASSVASASCIQSSIGPVPSADAGIHCRSQVPDAGLSTSMLISALNHLPAGLALFDCDLRLVYCNKVLREMLDYPEHLFAEGAPTMERIFRFNAERGEYGKGNVEEFVKSRLALAQRREPHTYERRRPNGAVLEVRGVPLDDGGFATIYLDVSAQTITAHTPSPVDLGVADKLTGLPTLKSVERQIAGCVRNLKPGQKACVMTIDLTRFSEINERCGRVVGDFVLREVAIRLSGASRGTDFLGRIGGDRFTILHPVVQRPSEPARLAHRLIDEIRRPICCGAHRLEISASVGFTMFDGDDVDVGEVLARSAQSMLRDREARSC